MIRMQTSKEDFSHILECGFQPHMQASDSPSIALSTQQWNWHVRRQTIFGREVWLVIEEETLFTICFFDLQQRDLKQLDVTLWLRLISEYAFMPQQPFYGANLSITDDFLPVLRSWMAPMVVEVNESKIIDQHALVLFQQVRQFLQQPLPFPISIEYEMKLTWALNTSHVKLQKQESVVSTEVIDFPLDGIDPDALHIDELTMMELIHRQLKSTVQNSLCPVTLFTSKVAQAGQLNDYFDGNVVYLHPKK